MLWVNNQFMQESEVRAYIQQLEKALKEAQQQNYLESLKAIQKLCIDQTDNCSKCLFYGRDFYGSPCCIFMYTVYEGVVPADWNLQQLEDKGLDNSEKL